MAFLDNSGDIILDAVLTDVGRKRMANGTFQITKFALGDDEIDYNLYDLNHPSGSAYYDLEILQTPILESVTGIAAHINYGLLSISNPNLLYMPTIKENNKVPLSARRRDNVYYLAVRDGVTAPALKAAFGGVGSGGDLQVLEAGQRNGTKIVLEAGLDTAEIPGTPSNKTNYITSQGLADAAYSVSVDTRFITTVLGPDSSSTFNNNAGSGESDVKFGLATATPNTKDKAMRNRRMASIRAINNNVVRRQNDNKADTDTSVIQGPRSTATALNFDTRILADDDFRRYGKRGQTISGASGTFKYIDTSVKVTSALGDTFSIPVRIIQKE